MSRRRYAFILLAASIALEATFAAAIVSGPTLLRVFELSKTELGVMLGMLNIGFLAMSALAGHTTHRWGGLPVLTMGMIGTLAGVSFLLVARNYTMLVIGTGLTGLTAAFVSNGTATILANLFPDKIRRIMALTAAFWLGSSSISAPLFGAWLSYSTRRGWSGWGFRVPFLICFMSIAAAVLVIRTQLRSAGLEHHAAQARDALRPPSTPMLAMGRWAWLWIPWLSVLHGTMLLVMISWGNPFVQEKFGVGEFQGALVFGVLAMGMGVGRLLLAMSRFEWDERAVLAASAGCGAVTFGLSLFMPSYELTLALVLIGGLSACASYPSIMALIGARFPKRKSQLYGYMGASIGLAGVVSPALVGHLADSGLPMQFALLLGPAAALLLAASGIVWIRRDRRAAARITPESAAFAKEESP